MNIRKLLKKVKSFLNAEERNRKEKKQFLLQVLDKLKKHEKSLVRQHKSEKDKKKQAALKEEITLTHAQRRKGLKMLKKI